MAEFSPMLNQCMGGEISRGGKGQMGHICFTDVYIAL